MKLATQGVAVVHNLIAGSFTAVGRGVNNGSESCRRHATHRTMYAASHGDQRIYDGSSR